MTTVLFLGRFQPFHNGHLWAVKEILKSYDKVVIGVGSSQYFGTNINPFSMEERKKMIEEAMKENKVKKYQIKFIDDVHNDKRWVLHVKKCVGDFDIICTGSELTRRLFSEKGYNVMNVERYKHISGTEVRMKMDEGKDWQKLVPKSVAKIINKKIKK